MSEDPDTGGPTAMPTAPGGDVEAYETDDGFVIYDARNPLAWIESRAPVRLDDVV